MCFSRATNPAWLAMGNQIIRRSELRPCRFLSTAGLQELTVPFGESGRCCPQLSHEMASAGFESDLPSGRAAIQAKSKLSFSRVVPLLPCHTHPGFSHENVGLLGLSSSGWWHSTQPAWAAKHDQTQFIHFRAESIDQHQTVCQCRLITPSGQISLPDSQIRISTS